MKFEPVPMQDAKAVQQRSLSIGVGNTFKLNVAPGFAFQLQDSNHENMVRSTKADFSEVIDQIVFRYSNPPTLIALGLLSPFQPNHLKFFPVKFLQENEEILVAMVQVLNKETTKKQPKPNPSDLQAEFERELGIKSTVDVWAAGWSSLHRKATNCPQKTKEDLMGLILGGKMSSFCIFKEPSGPSNGPEKEKHLLGKRNDPMPERKYPRDKPDHQRGQDNQRTGGRDQYDAEKRPSQRESLSDSRGLKSEPVEKRNSPQPQRGIAHPSSSSSSYQRREEAGRKEHKSRGEQSKESKSYSRSGARN